MAASHKAGSNLQEIKRKKVIKKVGHELGETTINSQKDEKISGSKVLINCPIEQMMFVKEICDTPYIIRKTNDLTDNINIHDQLNPSDFVPIFTRPFWTSIMTSDEVKKNEQRAFLDFKKRLYSQPGTILTPFEKNIEIWCHFWRVVENSDVICQIVDARNPLFYFSAETNSYVKKIDDKKSIILILNKADLLTSTQLSCWKNYFHENKITAIFFSSKISKSNHDHESFLTSTSELIDIFTKIHEEKALTHPLNVGFPNVGKSSIINHLIGSKKTAISAIPGKTKHIQTLVYDQNIKFYDCPGMVLPKIISGKDELLINGILSIDHTNDVSSAIGILTSLIPVTKFEEFYKISIPSKDNFCDPIVLLASLSRYLGYSKAPDLKKSAKIILKNFTSGDLIYCFPPPDIEAFKFNNFDKIKKIEENIKFCEEGEPSRYCLEKFDREFFENLRPQSQNFEEDSPFRKLRKGPKRPKKEKLRRIYKNPL